MPVSDDDATNFYVSAKCFKETFKIILYSPHGADKPALVFLPTQTLIGFAFELYFKAWLASAGFTATDLRKRYGHKLADLMNEVNANGLPRIPMLKETIDAIKGGHGDYSYRYFQNKQYAAMGLRTVEAVLDALDLAVDTKVGVSVANGLVPGH